MNKVFIFLKEKYNLLYRDIIDVTIKRKKVGQIRTTFIGELMFKTRDLNYKNIIQYKDIHIIKSKINFITGQSGCGKSTLLKLFNKTLHITSGDILYKDESIEQIDSITLRKKVKLISQNTFLFSGSIRENFNSFYLYCEAPILSDEQMKKFLGITEANFPLDTLCDNLSGGEKQRVYIAICLSMEAETIMLDEPTSALDYNLAVKVLKNIVEYVKENNLTLIVISHDNKLTEQFAENIVELGGGKINE